MDRKCGKNCGKVKMSTFLLSKYMSSEWRGNAFTFQETYETLIALEKIIKAQKFEKL